MEQLFHGEAKGELGSAASAVDRRCCLPACCICRKRGVREGMSKHRPIEGPRILDAGMVVWKWQQPWCCYGCRRFGYVHVELPPAKEGPIETVGRKGTTDDEFKEKIDRAHKELSPFCIHSVMRLVVGRIFRLKRGQKIYLRFKSEKPEDVKEQVWPPWEEKTH